mmetsp:Transcript_91515/g.176128  ORF Transcript_91515/g.176128 Transcript_91515/m.176128 type:complete len:204 (+) Transcript_91515:213-824(+)
MVGPLEPATARRITSSSTALFSATSRNAASKRETSIRFCPPIGATLAKIRSASAAVNALSIKWQSLQSFVKLLPSRSCRLPQKARKVPSTSSPISSSCWLRSRITFQQFAAVCSGENCAGKCGGGGGVSGRVPCCCCCCCCCCCSCCCSCSCCCCTEEDCLCGTGFVQPGGAVLQDFGVSDGSIVCEEIGTWPAPFCPGSGPP